MPPLNTSVQTVPTLLWITASVPVWVQAGKDLVVAEQAAVGGKPSGYYLATEKPGESIALTLDTCPLLPYTAVKATPPNVDHAAAEASYVNFVATTPGITSDAIFEIVKLLKDAAINGVTSQVIVEAIMLILKSL